MNYPDINDQQIDHTAQENRAENAHHIARIGIPDEADMYTHGIHNHSRNDAIQTGKNKEITSQYINEFKALDDKI